MAYDICELLVCIPSGDGHGLLFHETLLQLPDLFQEHTHEYRMGHLACSTAEHDRCNEVVPELNEVHPLETRSFLYECIVCVYIHS